MPHDRCPDIRFSNAAFRAHLKATGTTLQQYAVRIGVRPPLVSRWGVHEAPAIARMIEAARWSDYNVRPDHWFQELVDLEKDAGKLRLTTADLDDLKAGKELPRSLRVRNMTVHLVLKVDNPRKRGRP